MVGWDNCCRGASAGGPCGIGLTYFGGWDVLWLGVGWLTMGCGGHRSVWLVRRAEVGGCMDNLHAQVVEQPISPGGYLLFNLGVLVRVGDSGVDHCSPSQCRVWQQPYAKTTLHKIRNIYTMHKKSPHAYKLIPLDVVIILKNFSARILCIYFCHLCLVYFVCHNFCLSCYVVL